MGKRDKRRRREKKRARRREKKEFEKHVIGALRKESQAGDDGTGKNTVILTVDDKNAGTYDKFENV